METKLWRSLLKSLSCEYVSLNWDLIRRIWELATFTADRISLTWDVMVNPATTAEAMSLTSEAVMVTVRALIAERISESADAWRPTPVVETKEWISDLKSDS